MALSLLPPYSVALFRVEAMGLFQSRIHQDFRSSLVSAANRRILPGFRLSLSFTLVYLSVLVLIPLAACFFKASTLSLDQFRAAVWTERARAAYMLTFGASFAAAHGRYGAGAADRLGAGALRVSRSRRLFDSLIDLPFALPTAVAGLVYSQLCTCRTAGSGSSSSRWESRGRIRGWRSCWC